MVAVTDEAGGFGAETAAPMARLIMAELFDVNEDRLVAGRRGARLMTCLLHGEGVPRRSVPVLRIDPLMLVAALGLMAARIYTLGTATKDDIEGGPNYFGCGSRCTRAWGSS